MDILKSSFSQRNIPYAVGGLVVVAVPLLLIRRHLKHRRRQSWPKDTVILYQYGRSAFAPDISPFGVKLETYLRISKIPYQNVFGYRPSSKKKMPWIEYNGAAISDTSIIIQYLNETRGVDLNSHLNPVERGVAQAFQILAEEHLYWILMLFRWQFDNDKTFLNKTFNMIKPIMLIITYGMRRQLWCQGLGRHTQGEIMVMFHKDLQSLSDFLGKKKFFFGDKPSEVDAAIFGQLSQFYWQFLGSGYETILTDKYPNLASYCERMKSTFWPDWDECITLGGTRKATR